MIEATGIDEFDNYLENEFSKLGFSYQEIKANGTRTLDNRGLEMFFVDYFDTPRPLADGLAVIFTISDPGNDKNPAIETMQATLFNDSLYKEFTPLIEKKYLPGEQGLLVKDDIIKELSALLKLKQQADKGLSKEFTRLGFDLNDLLKTAERVNEHEIFLSQTIEDDARLDPGAKVRFSFSVTNSPTEQMYSIEHFTVVMKRSTSGSENRVSFENDYFRKDAPLPTMEEVFEEIAASVKRKEIREKFGLDRKNAKENVGAKKVTTKRKMS